MIFKHLASKINVEDKDFDLIYPKSIRDLADIYFSPIDVSIKAAAYLSDGSSSRILDIGSGVGKFCMIGATQSKGLFVGVEYRKSLWRMANTITQKYNLSNVEFIHSNINKISFTEFDAFYFFNSFYENMHFSLKINDEVKLNQDLYHKNSEYMKDQLARMPKGTKLVTYYSHSKEIPPDYKVVHVDFEGKLKMWKKAG